MYRHQLEALDAVEETPWTEDNKRRISEEWGLDLLIALVKFQAEGIGE